MKALQTIIAVAALLHAANTFAQTEEVEDATSYKAEFSDRPAADRLLHSGW